MLGWATSHNHQLVRNDNNDSNHIVADLLRVDPSPQIAKRTARSSSAPLSPASSIRVARRRRCSFDSPQKSFGSFDGIGCRDHRQGVGG